MKEEVRMKKKIVLVMRRIMLVAFVVGLLIITVCFSKRTSECFKVLISEQNRKDLGTNGHKELYKKHQVLNRRMLVPKNKSSDFLTRRGGPVTRQSNGVMFHSVPSTPNPIQNKYPNYGHH